MNICIMSSKRLTHSQYAHQKAIETFSNLVTYLKEEGLTHISQTHLYSAIIQGIGYKVHRHITTGLLPFKQFSDEQPWTDEEEW